MLLFFYGPCGAFEYNMNMFHYYTDMKQQSYAPEQTLWTALLSENVYIYRQLSDMLLNFRNYKHEHSRDSSFKLPHKGSENATAHACLWRRDSAVSIATGCGLEDREFGVWFPVGPRISSCPCQDQLCGPPSLLSNRYRGLIPRGQNDRGVKLTANLQLMPRWSKRGSIHPLPHTPSRRRAELVKHRDKFTLDVYLYRLVVTSAHVRVNLSFRYRPWFP
jgi:hypothetical protein